MKRYLLSLLLIALSFSAFSQYGTFKAVRFVNVTDSTEIRNNPINGTIYYNTQSNKFRVYQNGSWGNLGSGGSSGGGFAPIDGSGTTVNGTADGFDWLGTLNTDATIDAAGWDVSLGTSGSKINNFNNYVSGNYFLYAGNNIMQISDVGFNLDLSGGTTPEFTVTNAESVSFGATETADISIPHGNFSMGDNVVDAHIINSIDMAATSLPGYIKNKVTSFATGYGNVVSENLIDETGIHMSSYLYSAPSTAAPTIYLNGVQGEGFFGYAGGASGTYGFLSGAGFTKFEALENSTQFKASIGQFDLDFIDLHVDDLATASVKAQLKLHFNGDVQAFFGGSYGVLGEGLVSDGSGNVVWGTLGGGGSGSVTDFSSGNFSPLFTTSVATSTSTPALSFTAVNQNANLVYSGPASGSAAAPTFRTLVTEDISVALNDSRTVTTTSAIVQGDNLNTVYLNGASPFNFTLDIMTSGTDVILMNIGTATVTLVNGSGVTLSGSTSIPANASAAIKYLNTTTPIVRTSAGSSLSQDTNGTDADFTAVANTIKTLPAATLTANRTITMPTGIDTDIIEFYNEEAGFTWLLSGASVYYSDGVTVATSLFAQTNYIIRKANGKWRISN